MRKLWRKIDKFLYWVTFAGKPGVCEWRFKLWGLNHAVITTERMARSGWAVLEVDPEFIIFEKKMSSSEFRYYDRFFKGLSWKEAE